MTLLNAALEWGKQFPVIPIRSRGKTPLTSHGLKDASQLQSTIKSWWHKWPGANIGIVCNGLLVLDFDVKEGGLSDGKPALVFKYGELPKTKVHRTGGGGEHWLYSVPTDLNIRPGSKKYGISGMDIRANDSYILVPPSFTEAEYKVIDDSPIAPAPEWLIELAKMPTPAKITTTTTAGEIIPEGQRNERLASLAGAMRRKGASPSSIEAALLEANKQCSPPLPDTEVMRIAGSISRYQPGQPDGNGHRQGAGAENTVSPASIDQKSGVPEICVTGRHLQDKTTDALAAIIHSNNPPRIFRHSGGLARVELTETGQPVISQIGESGMRGELERAAVWFNASEKGKSPASPPLEVVRDFLTMPGGWSGIPIIIGVTENPVIRPDGSVLEARGYDPDTCLYYYPSANISIPSIPDNPSSQDIDAARELLYEVFCDFPFDSPISRTNVLAALITPAVRPLIKGPTPLCIIDKPQVGSGASLIATVIAVVTTGRPAAMMTAPRDPDEWRKTITSALMQGRGIVVIDNLEGSLYDANLAAVLTATTFAARVLGTNAIVDLPNIATWIATGNNVLLGGDLPRRAYLVRIDAGLARPWLRDVNKFKHPELETWAAENRGRILAAILTLARSWITAGHPQTAEIPRLGGYESWVRVIGGILAHAGIKGFLGNLMELYERNDAETPAWTAFTAALYEKFGAQPVTGADLMKAISDDKEFESLVPIDPPHRDKVTGLIEDQGFTRRLGKALAARKGRIYPGEGGDYKLDLVGISHSAKKWQVTKEGEFGGGRLPGFEAKREFGECETTPYAQPQKAQTKERVEINSPNSLFQYGSKLNNETPLTGTNSQGDDDDDLPSFK